MATAHELTCNSFQYVVVVSSHSLDAWMTGSDLVVSRSDEELQIIPSECERVHMQRVRVTWNNFALRAAQGMESLPPSH